ncbi:MAG TPA: hypothetical protein VEI27_02065, partial [Dehalococcoidales bacterium]|nr:hypothetical protein [Dehalococcoidales bacterium]
MRPLAPSLTAAQKACNRVPALSVTATDKLAGVARLHWERVYSGAEADFYHGAVIAGDGALVRLRVGPSADNNRLYRQRILNPGAESDFSQWQNTGIYDCRAVAVVSHGAEVNIFWVDA